MAYIEVFFNAFVLNLTLTLNNPLKANQRFQVK